MPRGHAILLALLAVAGCSAPEAPRWASGGRRAGSAGIVVEPRVTASTNAGVAALTVPGAGAILIRSGTFMMGSSETEITNALTACRSDAPDACGKEVLEHEYPPHDVLLSQYWIDRTEVAVARYRQCVDDGVCAMPPLASGGERFDRPELPIVLVTHGEASTFCGWANGRLPTEAEWERAARGPSARQFPWGNAFRPELVNHGHGVVRVHPRGMTFPFFARWVDLQGADGFLELAPVGSFPNGASADGILDLAGNAEEWVLDNYAPEYPRASLVDPRGPDSGDERVVRGGSYAHARTWLRGAARGHDQPTVRRAWRGFRCVYERRD